MTARYRLILAALALLGPLAATGDASRTFTFNVPTERVNGDPLPLNELEGFTVQCGTQPGGPYTFGQFPAPNAGTANQSINPGDVFTEGTYYCVATAIDTEQRESGFSNEVNFTVGRCESTDCRPRPPVLSVNP